MSTWILFPLLLLQFYAFLAPLLWELSFIPIIVIYTVASALAVAFVYITCSIDPADDALCRYESNRKGKRENYHPFN